MCITRWLVASALLVASAGWVGSQPSAAAVSRPETAVESIARAYINGVLAGDVDRVAATVHPELTRVSLMTMPRTGRSALRRIGASRLLGQVRARGALLPESLRDVRVATFEQTDKIAAVRVSSARYYELLQLAKIDGEWRILCILWAPVQPAPIPEAGVAEAPAGEGGEPADAGGQAEVDEQAEADREAIRAVALDYVEGAFSGEAERIERAVHPELTQVSVESLDAGAHQLIDHMGSGLLIEAARAHLIKAPPPPAVIDVVIDEVEGDLAAATVTSVAYVDLLQLARVDGAWRIVNVVWTVDEEALDAGPGSAAPQRPASGPSPDSRD